MGLEIRHRDTGRVLLDTGSRSLLSTSLPEGTDLRGADLRGADLRGQNFASADLRGATLEKADLRWARLEGACLQVADLRQADLREASLVGARLHRTDLREADLRGARFFTLNVELDGSSLKGANLRGALYDRHTAWPAFFRPRTHGCVHFATELTPADAPTGRGDEPTP
jgi:uncharacterized protein YjbI with pentapeptide repeats